MSSLFGEARVRGKKLLISMGVILVGFLMRALNNLLTRLFYRIWIFMWNENAKCQPATVDVTSSSFFLKIVYFIFNNELNERKKVSSVERLQFQVIKS
jgi:hypothetical protein